MQLPGYIFGDIAATLAFGLIAIVLLILGYKLFDKVTSGVSFDEELKKGNMAVATTIGLFILALAWIIVSVITAIVS